MHTAERIIATLRAHEAELRRAGLQSVSLFGSVARGEIESDSDIDLAAEFGPAARMDLLQLAALERRIAELLGGSVDLLPEPAEKSRLQDQINRAAFVPSRHDPASLADKTNSPAHTDNARVNKVCRPLLRGAYSDILSGYEHFS
jgi:uncharacterized protein